MRMTGENNHQFGLKGSQNASWKSDERMSVYGYRMIRMPDHPFANTDGFVFEHRLVAERYLLNHENSVEVNGIRYLKSEYDVHHIDGSKCNNMPDNLLVVTKAEHRRIHNHLNPMTRDHTTGQFIPRQTM